MSSERKSKVKIYGYNVLLTIHTPHLLFLREHAKHEAGVSFSRRRNITGEYHSMVQVKAA